jgi:hypothetical protein
MMITTKRWAHDRLNDLLSAEQRLPELSDTLGLMRPSRKRCTATWPAFTTASPDPTSGMLTAPAATTNRPPSTMVELVADLAVGPAGW